jgi:hypothetical protein
MNKVKPSQVERIQEVDNMAYLKSETYIHYFNRLMLMITSLFKWENLPNNIPERFIEKILFEEGNIAFIDDESVGLMVARCMQYDKLNLYDTPVAWLCYSNNGYYKDFKEIDIEIIRNNKYSIPSSILINHHLQRLYNLEITIDKNLWFQRNMGIVKSSDETALTRRNIVEQYDKNSFIIYGKKNLDTDNLLETLSFDVPFIADKLEDIKDRKWNDLIGMFGINSANTSKKERLITDEANANNQLIDLSVDVLLAERKEAVAKINERWGLDIKVSLRNKREIESKMNEDNQKGGEQ